MDEPFFLSLSVTIRCAIILLLIIAPGLILKSVGFFAYTLLVAALSISAYRLLAPDSTNTPVIRFEAEQPPANGIRRPSEPSSVSPDDPAALAYDLQSRVLSVEESIPLVRAAIGRQWDLDNASRLPNYWDKDWDARRFGRSRRMHLRGNAVRAELLNIYGDEVTTYPVVADLFFPLSPEFDFFTSAQQLAVVDWRLRQPLPINSVTAPGPGTSADSLARQQSDTISTLPGVLDDEDVVEYGLRESARARMLRSSGIQFDETEFRAAYLALTHGAPAGTSPVSLDELQSVLGRDKYLALKAQYDPGYSALVEAANNMGLPDDAVHAVYVVINDTNRQLRSIRATHAADPQLGADMMQAVLDDRRTQIEAIVGEDEAALLMEALNRRYQQLGQGSR